MQPAGVLRTTVSQVNGSHVVTLAGELDSHTAVALRHRLVALVEGGATSITFDLADLEFVDSTGLGVLVGTQKRLRQHDGGVDDAVERDGHALVEVPDVDEAGLEVGAGRAGAAPQAAEHHDTIAGLQELVGLAPAVLDVLVEQFEVGRHAVVAVPCAAPRENVRSVPGHVVPKQLQQRVDVTPVERVVGGARR